MAPTEANHGSGDINRQSSPPDQHQPATQQTEQYPTSISLPQTPETAQRAFGLNDSDHPGIEVDNTPTDLANGAPSPPGPHIRLFDSPPRPESRLTPPQSPASGLGSIPARRARTATWFHDQGVGLGLTSYPPGTPGAAGDHAAPAPEGEDAPTCGGGQMSSGKE
ncbi:hypothetical protein F5144DRAFT_604466 [Chaetomium tenue]|uniref:Uncharacterized protein n=1 Tax=Chaetomium tenue TaxID=1854479 RepID=A0ACB7P8J1_9PEZI|nr:hypothetical protein F5144DRAFT_604466 [Chaetomium globosum]